MKRKPLTLKRVSLLLVCALLIPASTLPTGSSGASAQSDRSGGGRKRQKQFGYRPDSVSADSKGRPDFLTGPNGGKPFDIAVGYLRQNRQKLGLAESDLAGLKVMDQYTSKHNGVTHIYLRQEIGGIEVVGAELSTNVARDGRVINLHSSFLRGLNAAASRRVPSLSPDQAVAAVAGHLGLTIAEPLEILEARPGAQRETVFSKGGISYDPIQVKLVYQPVASNRVRLAWSVEVHEISGEHWWDIRVDAETGEILAGDDYTDHDNWGANFAPDTARNRAAARAAAAPRALDAISPPATVNDGSAYNVFALPLESPTDGGRTLVMNPADALASPFGWHDTNGAPGPEFTITRGNNVHAYTDVDANNVADPGSDPDGGPTLQFNFPLDFSQGPESYRPAAVVNLFYWNNIVHDVFYRYGFTELAGNFQINNYGRGPTTAPLGANDDVRAEAQDGSGTNNANFSTGTDGNRPRMQMFVWTHPIPNTVTVNAPSPIAGDYQASRATFGPQLMSAGITADVILGIDPENADGPSATDGCSPLTNAADVSGKIAIVDRGTCPFSQKVFNAQNAGAVAVIVANNAPGDPVTMGFTAPIPTITIPSVMVSLGHADLYKANLPFNATLRPDPDRSVNRDSDFDAGVIAHEYGHGISNRLTGGRTVVSCLGNAEQMGEGWSDYIGLVLTTDPSDTAEMPRGIGTYLSFQPGDGNGIRPTPYTTDMTINPSTYDSIKNTAAISQPHGIGYVWATMLWEMYWNLVGAHGYNPNVYEPWNTGGNNLAIQLVMDGMKLQPCQPGFVTGRNAILQADQNLTGGANECAIWKAFAKRGLGLSASQGASNNRSDGTEAFDLPAQCRAMIEVAPPSLTQSLIPNTQANQTLTVKNTNTNSQAADLNWTVSEGSCAAPADIPWASVSPAGGTLAPQGEETVTVNFDSTGLPFGQHTGKLCFAGDGGSQEVDLTLNAIYDFGGFFGTIANPPAFNVAQPGSIIPILFTLNGDYGLNIFAPGFPASREINCTTMMPVPGQNGNFTPAGTPGNSHLSYDPASGRYNYPWQTSAQWRNNMCRELVVKLDDGTEHNAFFQFKK